MPSVLGARVSWLDGPVDSGAIVGSVSVDGVSSAGVVMPRVVGPAASQVTPAGVTALRLLNAATDQPIGNLVDGTVIDISGAKTFNVTAEAPGYGSVSFYLNGKLVRTESVAPFAVGGNDGSDFFAWNLPAGNYTLTSVPYVNKGGTGTAGASRTVSFVVRSGTTVPPPVSPPPATQGITSLKLVNAATDSPIGEFTAGTRLDLSGGKSYNVDAQLSPGYASVRFFLDGREIRVESTAPFTAGGNDGSDYFAWNLSVGSHTLTVVPYANKGGMGTAGVARTVNFSVSSGTAAPPVVPPTIPSSTPPATATFTQLNYSARAANPIARAESLTATYNNRVYTFGGFNQANGPVLRSDYFDLTTNSWTRIKDLPERLTHVGMTHDAENAYFVGGYVGTGYGYGQVFGSRRVWAYNFATDTYTPLPQLPQAYAAGGAALLGRELHYFGGQNANRADVKVHLVLNLDNPASGWQSGVPIPTARSHMGAVSYGGRIYAIAGQIGNDEGLTTLRTVEIYDPAANAWTNGAMVPAAVSHVTSATFEMGGRILLMGGEAAHGSPVRGVYAYNPATNAWTTLSPLPAARFSGVAGEVNGKIVFTTGSSSTTTWLATPV
ncbi:hypothetical protein IPV69_11625 [Humisphaera borealis]|uniref:Kelch-like protein n=1 Tax=Humisphaera borealis TaxID=2807512 RepID=A0A7M2X2G8_9BACT|nr:hypothetical protein IPV69_11625 [Humisphaera borealis]